MSQLFSVPLSRFPPHFQGFIPRLLPPPCLARRRAVLAAGPGYARTVQLAAHACCSHHASRQLCHAGAEHREGNLARSPPSATFSFAKAMPLLLVFVGMPRCSRSLGCVAAHACSPFSSTAPSPKGSMRIICVLNIISAW